MWQRLGRDRLILILSLLALALTPLFGQPYFTRFATSVLVFGLVAISLDLIVGYGGMVSFGHAAFFGVGAYATAILGFYGIHSAFLAIPTAVAAAALAALLIGSLSLRTSGVYFIMITLAFAQMLYYVSAALVVYGGNDGLKVARNDFAGFVPVERPSVFFYLVLAIFVLSFGVSRRLVHSRFGRVLRGIKDNCQSRNRSYGDAWRDPRLDRAQWCRKDHLHQSDRRPARTHLRQHSLRRCRCHRAQAVPARRGRPRAIVPGHKHFPELLRARKRRPRGAGTAWPQLPILGRRRSR
jgi:hypothetical protein